ncbi:MAG: hypothetical protein M1813_001194 [Trichoglossum hirsutum]|nr:MAG: hypothetical protein M1813_001194 [Trichoglossum hirsutum]
MSFSFSVSDIVLVSQLAYKLYGALATGRKGAPSSFTELSGALFGLRCALDHLSRHATKIPSSTSLEDWEANKMRQNLDTMIGNCAATLSSLQEILGKYASDVPDAPATNVPLAPGKEGKRVALKKSLVVNFNRVKWVTEEKTLAEIRSKLQSHTAAIDLVVSTYLWYSLQFRLGKGLHADQGNPRASTREIHETLQSTSDKAEEMHKMMLDNSDTVQLIKEIHQLLLKSQQVHQPPALLSTYPGGDLNAGGSQVVRYSVPIRGKEATKIYGAATDTFHGKPEIGDRARIPSVNCQRDPTEYQLPLPVTHNTSISHSYHTQQNPSSALFTSPAVWLHEFESTLTDYLSSPSISTNDKRSRQTHIIKTLSALNTYLSSIPNKASRRDLRRQLGEEMVLARVFEKAQGVLGSAVVLVKLIETYEDDKAEDEGEP